MTLDEVQREPGLLSAVKRAIDHDRTPGRFLLIGSANLLLMRHFAHRDLPRHLGIVDAPARAMRSMTISSATDHGVNTVLVVQERIERRRDRTHFLGVDPGEGQ